MKPTAGLSLLLLLAVASADAHHSGLYDESEVVTVEGTITELAWVNPHVRLTVDVAAGTAEHAEWRLEGTSVNALERWGIEPELFTVDTKIVARGPVSRFGRREMIAATVELASGELVVLWPNVASRLGLADTGVPGLYPPPSAAATAPATGIYRVWTPRERSRPAALPLTDRALEAVARYDPFEDDPALRCEPPGMPSMLDTPYPVEFVAGDDRIIMRFEEWDGLRTIYMVPGSGPPVEEPSAKGVSFGRWEGETLAILTTNISYPFFDDVGTPQSGAVLVMERYTPDPAGTRLDWAVTVTDPENLSAPVLKTGYMSWEPGETIKPFDCTLLD